MPVGIVFLKPDLAKLSRASSADNWGLGATLTHDIPYSLHHISNSPLRNARVDN